MGVLERLRGRSQPAPRVALVVAPAPAPVPDAAEQAPERNIFRPAGPVDEDGYSTPTSYAEKAARERDLLESFEARITKAAATGRYNEVVALTAYADDLRDRVARFEALAHRNRLKAA
jgi:hypothetical protein